MLMTFVLFVPTAAAISDIDFTMTPPDGEMAPNETFDVKFFITTQTENGYVDFTIEFEYNEDILKCTAAFNNEEGFSGTASQGKLTLKYNSATPSPRGNEYILSIPFTVLEGAPGGETEIKANVIECFGLDESGNKVNITTAKIYNKKIKIAEIAAPVSSVASVEESSYPGFGEEDNVSINYIDAETESDGGGAGQVFVTIVLGIVIFSAGCVAGYIFCQKKMDSSVGQGTYRRNLRNYDDEEDFDSTPPSAKSASARRPQRQSLTQDDNYDDDTGDDYLSYFGRQTDRFTTESPVRHSADSSSFSSPFDSLDYDTDDAGGFPDSFFPRNYSDSAPAHDDGFGSFRNPAESVRQPRASRDSSTTNYFSQQPSNIFDGLDDTDRSDDADDIFRSGFNDDDSFRRYR